MTHLLLLPPGTDFDDVEALALCRYPFAKPETAKGVRRLALTRHSTLVCDGDPLEIELRTLTEREDPPLPGLLDRNGMARCFPDGLPFREEGRALHLLVSIARRLGGQVKTDSGSIISPDVEAATDHLLATTYWLHPEDTLALVRRVVPAAHTAPGPKDIAGVEEVRLDGYAVIAPCGEHGQIEVRVGEEEHPPSALKGVDWAKQGITAYRAIYVSFDESGREAEFPSAKVRDQRHQAWSQAADIVRELHGVLGGEVLDEDGFMVDPLEV